jgi:pSer/pThr/pTyr-binding forkhead associated (FHA) protein
MQLEAGYVGARIAIRRVRERRVVTQIAQAVITHEDTEYRLKSGGTLTIGRHRRNDIVIHSASVSRFHATISWREGRAGPEIVDHGSQNGTSQGGLVVGRQPVSLRDGTPVLLGSRVLQVRLRNEGAAALLEDAPEVVALFTEQGSEASGSLDTVVDLFRVLRILEAEHRTGTVHVVPAEGEPGRLTLCQGLIMAVEKGIATRTRALEHLLAVKGACRYRFTPDLEPTDAPMNLWFSDYLRTWNRGFTPKRPHRYQRDTDRRNVG